jgi:hypothetical protein
MLRLPRPLRAFFRDRGRLRHLVERHPMPALSEGEKRQRLIEWARRSGTRVFVETGTYRGDTIAALAGVVERCVTIEWDEQLWRAARDRFASDPRIEVLHGDSGELLPKIVSELREPALFWLDAHYSGSGTARGALDTPIVRELRAVLAHPVRDHVVLIDDAREFVGGNGYPTMRELARLVGGFGYFIRVRDDLVLIYARADL